MLNYNDLHEAAVLLLGASGDVIWYRAACRRDWGHVPLTGAVSRPPARETACINLAGRENFKANPNLNTQRNSRGFLAHVGITLQLVDKPSHYPGIDVSVSSLLG